MSVLYKLLMEKRAKTFKALEWAKDGPTEVPDGLYIIAEVGIRVSFKDNHMTKEHNAGYRWNECPLSRSNHGPVIYDDKVNNSSGVCTLIRLD